MVPKQFLPNVEAMGVVHVIINVETKLENNKHKKNLMNTYTARNSTGRVLLF